MASSNVKSDDLFDVEDDWGDGPDDWSDDVTGNYGNSIVDVDMATGAQSSNKQSDIHNVESSDISHSASNTNTNDAARQLQEMSLDNVPPFNQSEMTGVNQIDQPSDSDIESMSECCVEDFAQEPESQILKDLLSSDREISKETEETETVERFVHLTFD